MINRRFLALAAVASMMTAFSINQASAGGLISGVLRQAGIINEVQQQKMDHTYETAVNKAIDYADQKVNNTNPGDVIDAWDGGDGE